MKETEGNKNDRERHGSNTHTDCRDLWRTDGVNRRRGKKNHTAHDGSVFQHCVHPEEHKTQMRGFWSSSKLNPATVIQSSNTPNPSTPLLAGNLLWLSLSQIYSLLLLLPCICISVSTADALGYVCYFFYVIYSSVWVSFWETLSLLWSFRFFSPSLLSIFIFSVPLCLWGSGCKNKYIFSLCS